MDSRDNTSREVTSTLRHLSNVSNLNDKGFSAYEVLEVGMSNEAARLVLYGVVCFCRENNSINDVLERWLICRCTPGGIHKASQFLGHYVSEMFPILVGNNATVKNETCCKGQFKHLLVNYICVCITRDRVMIIARRKRHRMFLLY